MPVAGQLEPHVLASVLEPWMATRLPEARDVRILDVVVPQSSGFSNETFLVDASWTDEHGTRTHELVVRSQAADHQLFPEADLVRQQFETMRLLGEHTGVPVPRMRWAERDESVLGRPFFVMDRLHGDVPADHPPYTAEGFVVDMDPATRRTWHGGALEAMIDVQEVDWRAIGLEHLDRAHDGALGPEQRHGYVARFWRWVRGDEELPLADAVWSHLDAHWPDDGEHVELCWGDARPGNMMFRGTEVVGVFDWEMVSLGNGESDLGWWLFLQRYHTEGNDVPLPEGMLGRAETIARWERRRGRRATNVEFYELLAGFQFCLIMVRLMRALGMPELATENPVADITRRLYAEA